MFVLLFLLSCSFLALARAARISGLEWRVLNTRRIDCARLLLSGFYFERWIRNGDFILMVHGWLMWESDLVWQLEFYHSFGA